MEQAVVWLCSVFCCANCLGHVRTLCDCIECQLATWRGLKLRIQTTNSLQVRRSDLLFVPFVS
jgi:hypothetical protein